MPPMEFDTANRQRTRPPARFRNLGISGRLIVQGIISDLEAQGELPRSNYRVSSLAMLRAEVTLWVQVLHKLRQSILWVLKMKTRKESLSENGD